MLFTSWIALCGWNKFTASLLRAIYSIHAIHFEPHARLPSFLLGNFHQALPVSLEFHTMSSPVGLTHPPQLQMQLRHSMISTQTWRSHGTEGLLICTHDLCCCVALIWLPLHLCLGQRAALGPCATAFTPQTVPVVHGPLPLISHAHVGWRTTSEGLWEQWFSLIMDRHQLTKPCHNLEKPGKTSFTDRGASENQALKDKVGPNLPHLVYFRIQEEHKWLHISVEVLLPRSQYKHSSKPLLCQEEGTENNNHPHLSQVQYLGLFCSIVERRWKRVLSYENSLIKCLPWSKEPWRCASNASLL